MKFPKDCKGFEWDAGNYDKNWLAHQVSWTECEEIFFNQPLMILLDKRHSQCEIRYYALGSTDADRKLFLVFAVRNDLIRVISARDMSKKERSIYDHAKKEAPLESA